MFWRKTRRTIAGFHPLHQTLVWQRTLSSSMPPEGWDLLVHSLSGHEAVVRRRRWALPPRVTDVLVPLVQTLGEDVARGGQLAVEADLRGEGVREKTGARHQVPVPANGRIRSITEWFVTDPWLRLRAELGDGSRLEVAVTDRIRHRKIHKIGAGGKHKQARKTRRTQVLRCRRVLPRGVEGTRPAQPPPPWVQVTVRDGRRRTIAATVKPDRVPQGPEQLDLILTTLVELFRWAPATTARRNR